MKQVSQLTDKFHHIPQQISNFNKMKILIPFFSLLLLFFSCNSDKSVENSIGGLSGARWISDDKIQPEKDSLFYLEDPAPLFRKEFKTEREIKKATLYISAAGYFKATINGSRVGKDVLSPAWTDYSKRIYYSEYDITSTIKQGENCVGVTLGNGFYNPLPLKMWGRRNMRDVLPIGNPMFIARLVFESEDGETIEIVSDGSWKFSHGPLLKNNVYLGEVFDARKEVKGWDLPDYDDSLWKNAKEKNGPGGELQAAFFPPVQVTKKIKPVDIYEAEEDLYVVDMGVNFTGSFQIRLNEKKGDTIVFRFGERIYEDGMLNPMTAVCGQIKRPGQGGSGAPDIAWQTDSYISDGEETVFSPEFTFHTYRYMEINGLSETPEKEDITGLLIQSNLPSNGNFSSSSDLINKIQEATDRTFRSNLVSVQSDCAAREKFGYGGDLNATSESFIYNYDMQQFYRKTIYDWVDVLNDSVFVDTAPFVGIQYCGLSWESAFLTTQYFLYLYYNDVDLVRELYDLDKKWMEKVKRLHPDFIVDKGLSDHESMEPVPVELTGTAHYLQCARIMTKFAEIMNDDTAAKEYASLADQIELRIKEMFWDKPVKEKINRQTLFSTLLYHNILPENEKQRAVDSLLLAVQKGPSGHFNTGIFGTKNVLEALSVSGRPDAVFDVVNSTTFPGWGHMIDQGATTIWETWKESDNTFSNCHPMFGSVTEWFYRWLGGIKPNPDYPGFKQFEISPYIPGDLDWVKSSYKSPNGEIVSNWKKTGRDITFEVQIPDNSKGLFKLLSNDISDMTIKSSTGKSKLSNPQKGTLLPSGKYSISGKLN